MKEKTTMNFGEAIAYLNSGFLVSRIGWNGKGLFIFKQVPSQISIDIVPKMQSLPQKAKDEFIKRGKDIRYNNQLALVNQDNSIQGWSPSTSDSLANDWVFYDDFNMD